MHPLISAYIERAKLREIQPRSWSPYITQWARMFNANTLHIAELQAG